MVLICISLMGNDVQHLLMCLFDICVFSLVKYLLKGFVCLLIGLFAFILLNFESSLYIRTINPLSYIWPFLRNLFLEVCPPGWYP